MQGKVAGRLGVCLLLAGVSPAANLWFSQKAGIGGDNLVMNNGRVITNLAAAALSCTRTGISDDLLYSVSWSGNDFDGDATNDTFSFDLRAEGFAGSAYTYSTNAFESSMTALGASSDVTSISNVWGVGGDYDVDAGQSLRFSVTNVQVSVPGYIGVFGGFTGVRVIEPNGGNTHQLVLGEGTGLDAKVFSTPDAGYTFDAVNRFVVTGAGSTYTNSREWAVTNIDFKFSVFNPTNPPVWDVTDYSEFATGPKYLDEYPAQQSFSNYPAFSWNTVPRWLIVRKRTAYTDADINSMAANYHLIVFEKGNLAGFATIEEGILGTAARVRAVNPATKNIFYWNSWIHYGDYAANAIYELHAWEWSNHTTDSNGTEIIDMFKDYYTHNYAVPEMRDWWVNTALGMAGNSAIDGVFIDRVGELEEGVFIDGEPATDYLKMVVALERGLPAGKLNLGNTLRNERNNGNRAYMEIEDGSYLERWNLPDTGSIPAQSTADSTAVSIQLMREALSKGKIILFKTSSPDEYAAATQSNMAANVDYPLAIFLIVAETNGYFAYQAGVDATYPSWNWDASWLPEFKRPLGRPLGDPVKDGYVYTRSYEHVDVRVDISTEEALLAWDSVDTDGDGLPDLWEYRNFGNVTNAVATANSDGDARNNVQEYIAGLNPNLADAFVISNFQAGANRTFGWNAVSGRVYKIYWATNLMDGFILKGSALNGSFLDAEPQSEPQGFYKITVELAPE